MAPNPIILRDHFGIFLH